MTLPGYHPPARIAAVADGSYPGDDTGALRERLAIAAVISLFSILLYAAALARPLLRGLNRVASVAEQAMIDPLTGARTGAASSARSGSSSTARSAASTLSPSSSPISTTSSSSTTGTGTASGTTSS